MTRTRRLANSALLLVQTPTPEQQHSGHTVVQALAENLPWTQQLDAPSTPPAHGTATERVATLLGEPNAAAPSPAISAAAELLDRRNRALDAHQKMQARNQRWTDHHAQQERERAHNRDHGGLNSEAG